MVCRTMRCTVRQVALFVLCVAVVLVGQASAAAASGVSARAGRSSSARRGDQGHPVDAKLFEPGACMEYQPTAGDRRLTVFLDAGHGGIDPGGIGRDENGNLVDEADETLPVELDTMALLRGQGFTVVVSRTRDETVSRLGADDVDGGLFTTDGVHEDVAARDVCADTAKANVLLGIYMDAGASSDNAGSVTGFDSVRPFAAANLRFANDVQHDVLAAMNAQGWDIPNLGVTDDSELGGPALTTAASDYRHLLLLGPASPGYFSTPSAMPGALIEPLFITDPYEGSIAESPADQKLIAAGLAKATEQYFVGGTNSSRQPHTTTSGTR
jgi:N-acetylmuramoyl-L-alanine amidase